MTKHPNLYAFPSTDALAAALRSYILHCQRTAFVRHGVFKVGVSGGSLPATLAKALLDDVGTGAGAGAHADPDTDTPQFSRWEVFFADERAVALDDADSNYALVKSELLDRIPPHLGRPKVHAIDPSLLHDTEELADAYQATLMASFAARDSVKLPVFDLILLGCGPDGHTCSLFPGHELLREADAWVAALDDSPKPPPRRITLTLPVLTHAHHVAFVATGAAKAPVLQKIFDAVDDDDGASLPCALVNHGAGDKVSWFCDAAAVEGVRFPRRESL